MSTKKLAKCDSLFAAYKIVQYSKATVPGQTKSNLTNQFSCECAKVPEGLSLSYQTIARVLLFDYCRAWYPADTLATWNQSKHFLFSKMLFKY